MLASVPVKVMVGSAVPSPTLKARPAIVLNVIVPLVAVNVTRTGLTPASTSLIETRFAFAVEKVSALFSTTVCGPGTLLTGASLTALTVTLKVRVTLSTPPFAVPPPSLTVTVIVAEPF